jgi:hypothetical protein
MEAVPGIGLVLEDQQRAFLGRNFGDYVFQVIRSAQQAQAAALRLPGIVHVDQHGDDLGAAVGVNLAVLRRRLPTRRHHGRLAFQAEPEFLFDSAGEFRALDRVHEGAEGGTEFQRRQGKAARMPHQRIVGIDRAHRFRLHEVRHHQEGEGLARQRCGGEGVDIDGKGLGHGGGYYPSVFRRQNSV